MTCLDQQDCNASVISSAEPLINVTIFLNEVSKCTVCTFIIWNTQWTDKKLTVIPFNTYLGILPNSGAASPEARCWKNTSLPCACTGNAGPDSASGRHFCHWGYPKQLSLGTTDPSILFKLNKLEKPTRKPFITGNCKPLSNTAYSCYSYKQHFNKPLKINLHFSSKISTKSFQTAYPQKASPQFIQCNIW